MHDREQIAGDFNHDGRIVQGGLSVSKKLLDKPAQIESPKAIECALGYRFGFGADIK